MLLLVYFPAVASVGTDATVHDLFVPCGKDMVIPVFDRDVSVATVNDILDDVHELVVSPSVEAQSIDFFFHGFRMIRGHGQSRVLYYFPRKIC